MFLVARDVAFGFPVGCELALCHIEHFLRNDSWHGIQNDFLLRVDDLFYPTILLQYLLFLADNQRADIRYIFQEQRDSTMRPGDTISCFLRFTPFPILRWLHCGPESRFPGGGNAI